MNSRRGSSSLNLAGLYRFAGAGIELAGLTVVFAFAGYGLDLWLGNDKLLATGILALIGFALALTRFIVLASRFNEQRPTRDSHGDVDRHENRNDRR